jgi:hypothetical protein
MEWGSFCWAIVVYTCIVDGFRKVAVDVVDIAHEWKQSAFPVSNLLQIVTRFWHSTDAGRSTTRWRVKLSLNILLFVENKNKNVWTKQLQTYRSCLFSCFRRYSLHWPTLFNVLDMHLHAQRNIFSAAQNVTFPCFFSQIDPILTKFNLLADCIVRRLSSVCVGSQCGVKIGLNQIQFCFKVDLSLCFDLLWTSCLSYLLKLTCMIKYMSCYSDIRLVSHYLTVTVSCSLIYIKTSFIVLSTRLPVPWNN